MLMQPNMKLNFIKSHHIVMDGRKKPWVHYHVLIHAGTYTASMLCFKWFTHQRLTVNCCKSFFIEYMLLQFCGQPLIWKVYMYMHIRITNVTYGWQCPTLTVTMPPNKSRYRLPSVSYNHCMCPWWIITGFL
jgi:hypothetical protein